MLSQKYPKIILICLACLLLAFFASNRLFRGDPAGWKLIISSDGLGYYAYLPALLIDNDVTFHKVTEREKKILGYKRYEPGYLVKSGDRVVDKYYAGEAFLLLPFFLLAIFFSWIAGIDISGYSFFFQIFTGIGALFYLLFGLYYLRKTLHYFRIQPVLSAIILVIILLGTNLFYYSVWQPCMSHVYSFFAINGFLWYSCRVIQNPKTKFLVLSGLFLGLVVLIRPTNGIVFFLLPFLIIDGQKIPILVLFLKEKKRVLIFPVAFIVIVSIQFILWHIQTGHWIVWSYKNEGFNFRNPQILNELFSFRKGLFIYTPLIFLSLLGIFRLAFQRISRFASVTVFLILCIYIISSWWNWYYGDSFGARAFIDYYGIFALLLAILLNHRTSNTGTVLVILLLFPFAALNLLQTWQYTHYIIHPYSMNSAKYRYVSLQTDSLYQQCLGGNEEIPGYDMDISHPRKLFSTDFEKVIDPWKNSVNVQIPYAHSGHFAGSLDSLHQFSATLEIKPEEIMPLPALFYIEGSVWIRDSLKGASNKALFVMSVDSIDQVGNYWYGFRVNDVPENAVGVWRNCKFSLTLPELKVPGKTFKLYIWDSGKKPFLIDDFKVAFYTRKKTLNKK